MQTPDKPVASQHDWPAPAPRHVPGDMHEGPSLMGPPAFAGTVADTAGNPSLSTYPPTFHQSVNVSVGGPNIAFVSANKGPGLLVRALYFVFVGWYLGGIWITLSYLMFIPIVTIPVFAKMINMLPQIMTLRPRNTTYRMRQQDDLTIIEESTADQHNFFLRAGYFVLIGWWLVAVWLVLAYLLALTIIGLPLAFLMFNRAGAVATLYKN